MAVTSDQVKAIIETTITDTTPFIAIAQNLATEELVGEGLSAERLDNIVLYLSAHFVCLTSEGGGLKRSRLGESDESYKTPGDKDTGLASTRFGQTALMLDTSGKLAAMSANKGLKALFTVVGDPTIPYNIFDPFAP